MVHLIVFISFFCIMFKGCFILTDDSWAKVFKSGLSKFCGRQSLKNLLTPLLNNLFRLKLLNLKTTSIRSQSFDI